MTRSTEQHPLKARRARFDFSDTPLHWIPGDAFSTHLVNGIHLLLPAGELWFCRVYNQALPLIRDERLREDVEGFIRQEAWHARAHIGAQAYLQRHDLQTEAFLARADRLFGEVLGDAPFGLKQMQRDPLKRYWLVLRVGLIAAIEHFTGMLGQWAMDNKTWDKADPVMADLFRWHLAEEVEHRCVAFDLFEHLCRTQLGFYVSRQVLMAAVFPLFIHFLLDGYRELAAQDRDDRASRRMARRSLLRLLVELERVGRRTENIPPLSFLLAGALRWISPRFHPMTEGDTQQALDYLARSPAARAATLQ
ncbi:metal-dependent hydrolase [Solimonas sp. SE-A11]|uniref:metal-dependent hydrolase n=1 Tax=Solimonas sp. SE-A11 TaxID=3054954 RepID=UPI00259D1292|nr:metal-dependent hydrolase [Solimonas sp. SE-A11]MDM4771852.1 metal-dependent hydrolase [Solimonas sp. SE-A11]